MTGSRIALRRWSGCNLHWRVPVLKRHRPRNYFDPPPVYNRCKLYITEDAARAYSDSSRKAGRDRHGPYVWMATDCGWEWLATRPGVNRTPLGGLFDRLHDHVHTKHREERVNVPLFVQRLAVRLLRSPILDERWATDVFPDAHEYWVQVRFKDLTSGEVLALEQGLPDPDFFETTLFTGSYTSVNWRERASSPSHARERAQARVRAQGLSLGGTFWETPIRLKTRETTE